jgi:hypothetical protein
VTVPFGINQQTLMSGRAGRITSHIANPIDYHDYNSDLPHSKILSGTPNDELKLMLWLTIGLLFLELFMMYIKYDFLNVSNIVMVVTGTTYNSIDIFTELLRHDIHQDMFRVNIYVNCFGPYLADDICW